MANIIIKSEKNTLREGEKDIIDYVDYNPDNNLIIPSEAMKRESYMREVERNMKISTMGSQKDIEPGHISRMNISDEDQQEIFKREKGKGYF